MDIRTLKILPGNPRQISGEQFERLKQSIREFPEMMALRPVVYDSETMQVLGGNMRVRAMRELGMHTAPDNWFIAAKDLTEQQKREFTIKDNIQLGSWDWDILANEWDDLPLHDWGIDAVPNENKLPSNVSYLLRVKFQDPAQMDEAEERLREWLDDNFPEAELR